jgi:c-di-GMP-binding flagellar brake protein YcgR
MSTIRPGLGVELIFLSDFLKDNIHVMRSVIYEVMDQKIILSQPSEELSFLSSALNKDIIVTFLIRKGGQDSRFGFKARIIERVNDYEIAVGQRETALVVRQLSKPETYEIRRFVRVRVPSAYGLELHLRGQTMNLIDISLGGAKFSHPEMPPLNPGDRTTLKLHIDEATFHLEADILRVWSPEAEGGSKNLKFGTLKFVDVGKELEQTLGRKIFELERKMLGGGSS